MSTKSHLSDQRPVYGLPYYTLHTTLIKLFPYFHLNCGVRILGSNIYSYENMTVKQAERGRRVIFRAFTGLCFYSDSRVFDLLEWVSFPQVKLENILSHPALNTSGVERHMQLKLAVCVCVCFMSNKVNKIPDPEDSVFPLYTEMEICRPRCATKGLQPKVVQLQDPISTLLCLASSCSS